MQQINEAITELAKLLQQHHLHLCTAESCTGGGLSYYLTNIAGSSVWFDRGFVTYSEDAKEQMLGVSKALLKQYGAVSKETVEAMAEGAVQHSKANIGIAITGIAGPDTDEKKTPVGTIWFAIYKEIVVWSECKHFTGSRTEVREQAILFAVQMLVQSLKSVF